MRSKALGWVCGLTFSSFLIISQPVQAVSIQFDYSFDTNGFFADSGRRALLDQAGTYLGSRLSDSLEAITSSDLNNFTPVFSNPSTGARAQVSNYSVANDTLIVFAGARNLSGTTVGVGGPGGFSARGISSFLDTVEARGQAGALINPATDFGPWGGSLTFNSNSNWYFDSDTNTTEVFSGNDFYSVALHELGHLLGIGTSNAWDTLVAANAFTGAASLDTFGSTVALGADQAHWANGTTSTINGILQETAMDPSITQGNRKLFTDLDFAALSDVGWKVTAVPLPASAWLFASGLLGLLGYRRRSS